MLKEVLLNTVLIDIRKRREYRARRRVYISIRAYKFNTPRIWTIYQSSASNLQDYTAFGGGRDRNVNLVVGTDARARKKKSSPFSPRFLEWG